MTLTAAFLFAVALAALLGLRASLRLTRRYTAVRDRLVGRERSVLRAFVVVSWTITLAALFFGGTALRRIFGFDPLDWAPPISVAIATAVLFVPVFLDATVERIARSPEDLDG